MEGWSTWGRGIYEGVGHLVRGGASGGGASQRGKYIIFIIFIHPKVILIKIKQLNTVDETVDLYRFLVVPSFVGTCEAGLTSCAS